MAEVNHQIQIVPELAAKWRLRRRQRFALVIASGLTVAVWVGFGVYYLMTSFKWIGAAYLAISVLFITWFASKLRRYFQARKIVRALSWIEPYWNGYTVSVKDIKGTSAVEQFEAFCAENPDIGMLVERARR